jgi:hypothetical protein
MNSGDAGVAHGIGCAQPHLARNSYRRLQALMRKRQNRFAGPASKLAGTFIRILGIDQK